MIRIRKLQRLINKLYRLLTFDDYCDDDDDGGAWKTMLVMENVVDASWNLTLLDEWNVSKALIII